MQKIRYPKPEMYDKLFKRPELKRQNINAIIEAIFDRVQDEGDAALYDYSKQFDNAELTELKVSQAEFEEANHQVPDDLKQAIQHAKANITHFHQGQIQEQEKVAIAPGVDCWRIVRPIDSVGLYVPGGTAPLFSTVLMLGIPAKLAQCEQVILCTPPNAEGKVHPAILYAAEQAGIQDVFKVGGAQAIAAMSLGTESVPKVLKLFGPGNQYVTAAKMHALTMGLAIDMPAGPSEVLVIADHSAVPAFVAADLLSQAEHGMDSQVILLTNNEDLLDNTLKEVANQTDQLPRKAIVLEALSHSKAILFDDIEQCCLASNAYAPEHLILAITNPEQHLKKITNAGSIFLGNYSCESLGDYASGTNHTLPTNGYARVYSGVSMDSFVKKITVQDVSAEGIKNIGPTVEIMAIAEQLTAHERAVTIRLNQVQ